MHTLKYTNIPSVLQQVPHSTDILFAISQHDNYFHIYNLLSSGSIFYRLRKNYAFTNVLPSQIH